MMSIDNNAIHSGNKISDDYDNYARKARELITHADPQGIEPDVSKSKKTLTEVIYGDETKVPNIELASSRPRERKLKNERTGRVVPFFPGDWNNGNSVFNEEDKQENGLMRTSGKHFSRHFDSETFAKYLHQATQPPLGEQPTIDGDAKSVIARQFENTKKIYGLMHKLKDYLNGKEIDVSEFSLPVILESTQMDSNSI